MTTREQLVEAFGDRGYELWLVGGALRDRMLGIPGHDSDFATNAAPDAIEAIASALGAPSNPVGKRFGTIGVLIDGHWTEITTFRGESYGSGTRWPDVTFGSSIEADLARRDFTVNAIAEDAFTGRLVDPFGGQDDLRRGLLRAVGMPSERFREDPLRILRGLRFVAQLGFQLDEPTFLAMSASAGLLGSLSQERVTSELDRLLQAGRPDLGLEAMLLSGALGQVLPEMAPAAGCEQNSFHRFDVWQHSVVTVAAIETSPDSIRLRRWAAFLHDIGKPVVRHRKPNGEWGFYRHDAVGAEIAAALLHRLRLGAGISDRITHLIRRHMDRPDPADRRSVRRFVAKAGDTWRDLVALKIADNASHTYDDTSYHLALLEACETVVREDVERLRAQSPLTGTELVTAFGRPAGPWLREVKSHLSDLVLDGRLEPGDREGALKAARGWLGRTLPGGRHQKPSPSTTEDSGAG